MAVPTQGKMAARSLSCCSAATGCRNRSTWTMNCESCTRYPCMFRPINRKTTGWNHRGSVTIYYGRISRKSGRLPYAEIHSSYVNFAIFGPESGTRSWWAVGRQILETGQHLTHWRKPWRKWRKTTRYINQHSVRRDVVARGAMARGAIFGRERLWAKLHWAAPTGWSYLPCSLLIAPDQHGQVR